MFWPLDSYKTTSIDSCSRVTDCEEEGLNLSGWRKRLDCFSRILRFLCKTAYASESQLTYQRWCMMGVRVGKGARFWSIRPGLAGSGSS